MIRVTVELIPGGVGDPECLGTLLIANDGTGTATMGNYDGKIFRRGRQRKPISWFVDVPNRKARVERHARQSLPVWTLVARFLRELGYSK